MLLLFIVFTVSTTVAQIPHDKNYKFLVGGDRCTRHLEDSTFDTMFQYDEMQKYEIVLNTPEDSLSLEALKEKASQGDDVAMLCLGNRYYTGKGVAKDENEAVKWYQQAAKLDNANAQNNLGYYYMEHADASLQGENKAEAIRLFDKARWSTSMPSGAAIFNRSWMYPKDKRAAQYLKAAQYGSLKAKKFLAACLLNGEGGCQKDTTTAISWLVNIVEDGDIMTDVYLGILLYNRKDYKNAAQCWSLLAQYGEPQSQTYLAHCYLNGLGVEKDSVKAFNLLQEAVNSENSRQNSTIYFSSGDSQPVSNYLDPYYASHARCMLGNLYFKGGKDIPQDYNKAYECYSKVIILIDDSDKKTDDSLYAEMNNNLGYCYEYGKGVDKKMNDAIYCYGIAAANGVPGAQENLDRAQEKQDKADALASQEQERKDRATMLRAERMQAAIINALARKYGKQAAQAMNELRPYVGMPEGAVRDFIYVDGDCNKWQAYAFTRVEGAYLLYLPTRMFQLFRVGGNLKAPSAIYMHNGRVAAVKW